MKLRIFLTGFLGFLFFAAAEAQALCPMCRVTLEMNKNQDLIRGFLFSILLIGGIPLLLASGIAFLFYRRRHKPS